MDPNCTRFISKVFFYFFIFFLDVCVFLFLKKKGQLKHILLKKQKEDHTQK